MNSGNYFLTAMMDAYFSLLEHLFVLLLPFINHIDLTNIDIEEFIGKNWKDKFMVIFDLNTDKSAQQMLNRLHQIKENFRNPLTHGYFEKKGQSFFVQMKHLGLIPMMLTRSSKQFNYRFCDNVKISFDDIVECFDDFDTFLKNSESTKYGIKYIESGLPISYNPQSCMMYENAMKDEDSFDQFIKYTNKAHENAANMDW